MLSLAKKDEADVFSPEGEQALIYYIISIRATG
jgi:hypothetical protein